MRLYFRTSLVALLLAVIGVLFASMQSGEPHVEASPLSGAFTNTPTIGPSRTPVPIPTAEPCGDWRLVPSPNGTTPTNFLKGVDALSENDIWAVGYQDYPAQHALTLHWDGTEWSLIPVPAPIAYLYGVAAIATDDVWAVGNYDGFPARNLILHWDGTAWTEVPGPVIGENNNYLYGVAAAAPDDVWAVGEALNQPIILHWDGTEWTQSAIPVADTGTLEGVTVIAPDDVWAVGNVGQFHPTQSLTLHWDGTEWIRFDSPSPGSRQNELAAVTAISSNDVWAVGMTSDQIYDYLKFAIHWDGTEWVEVPTPLQGEGADTFYGAYLDGVAANSSNEVYAVGRYEVDSSDSLAVALRWDGTSWIEMDIDQPSLSKNRFHAVTAVQPGEVWAVGTYYRSSPGYSTLTMRYGPQCGPGTPGPSNTPTPRPPTNTRTATRTATPPPFTATSTPTGTLPTATNTPTATETSTPAPTACGALFTEGFEGGSLGQFTDIVAACAAGTCGWVTSITDPNSGDRSAFAPDINNISDQRLQLTESLQITAGQTLTFWHSYDFETNFDGGVLEASTNGGATWTDMAPNMSGAGYNGNISISFDNPLAGRRAWTGSSDGYVQTTVDLNPYAARSLIFRFRLGTDSSIGAPGWHIDDIVVLGPGACPSMTVTPNATATSTLEPGQTQTVLPTEPVGTETALATGTAVATGTETETATPEPTVGACALTFSDVQPGSTFYAPVMCLACMGLVNGYPDGTFRPQNEVTRGQLAKLVSNTAGFNEAVAPTTQSFADVPVDSPFHMYTERVAFREIINGYPCGGPGEPCDAENRPYFRPGNNATRGQISKIVSIAAKMLNVPTTQTFEDVPPDYTFYVGIERLAMHGMMNGYPCGGPGEPCGPENRPYFRPGANATRGQTAKILVNTFYPDCQAP